MSFYIRIICKSTNPIASQEIIDFIENGAYLDNPSFLPSSDVLDKESGNWSSFSLTLNAVRPAITFDINAGDDLFREERAELLSSLIRTQNSQEIKRHLDNSKQTISIELDLAQINDDDWEMLDSLEGYLARKYEGLIYVLEEGYFDHNLKLLYKN